MKTIVGGAGAAVWPLIVRPVQIRRKNPRRNCDMRRQFIMLEILKVVAANVK